MKDIYQGRFINARQDENTVFLSFAWITFNIPREHWNKVIDDLSGLVLASTKTKIQEVLNERKN